MRQITAYISDHELPGTASKETIRRVLQGTRVPVQWLTAEAIFLALCALARTDPESTYWDDQINHYSAPPPGRGFDEEPPF